MRTVVSEWFHNVIRKSQECIMSPFFDPFLWQWTGAEKEQHMLVSADYGIMTISD